MTTLDLDDEVLARAMKLAGVQTKKEAVNIAVGSCQPQRAEFRRSARNRTELELMTEMFDELYPDLPVPKAAWRWVGDRGPPRRDGLARRGRPRHSCTVRP